MRPGPIRRALGLGGDPRWHHRPVTAFDLLLRGGLVIDGTGAPGQPGDVGVLGDRILAVGDLSSVDDGSVATVVDVAGRVVAPGFIDPHGHSDGSLFVDGALISHLAQGFTTQLSGNCGDTLAPITDRGRELVELSLRPNELVARWRTFGEYLDAVDEVALGPNVAFLVGHGTVRGAIVGPDGRAADDLERHAMVREVNAAMDVGAFGLSSGLIYAPGMHAGPDEMALLVTAATRRGGLYATHMRDETTGVFASLEESIATVRAAADAGVSGPRLQVSHLKCGARAVWGRADEAVALLEAARAEGLDVGADQYPYTAAATTLATILPPALLGLGVDACIAALSDLDVRDRIRSEMGRGISGWENVAADPGWDGIVISWSASHPDWAGASLRQLGERLDRDPSDVAFDALVDDRLDVSIVIHCMDEADVETIMAVPWIAVCTDAEGRRPGHPTAGRGRAASPDLRVHRPRARHVRPRARNPVARDGRGEADVRACSPPRAARSRRRSGGRVRRPRRGRPDDGRRHGDVRAARPAIPSASTTSWSTAGSRSVMAARPATAQGGSCGTPAEPSCRPRSAPTVVHLPGGPLPYTLRHSPRARTLRVVIDPDRGVLVTVPATRADRCRQRAPRRRSSWASARPGSAGTSPAMRTSRPTLDARGGAPRRRLRPVPRRAPRRPGRSRGQRGPPVGRGPPRRTRELIVHRVARDRRSDAAIVERWLRAQAARRPRRGDRPARRRNWASTPAAVTLRDPRSRWGSASRAGRLSFSWRLVLAPPEALESVVVHELAHLRVFGHGPRFWALVATRMPDHRTWRRWLHDHALELHRALEPTTIR